MERTGISHEALIQREASNVPAGKSIPRFQPRAHPCRSRVAHLRSPAFRSLVFLTPTRANKRDPHCGDHLNITVSQPRSPAPTHYRLDRHAAWNTIATLHADCVPHRPAYMEIFSPRGNTDNQPFVALLLAFPAFHIEPRKI